MNKSDNQNPLVSVIIPVHNRSELLPRTVRSVVTQTYRNLEIIIIDDGSSEDIKSMVDGFNDSRIRYLRHDTNRGVAEARNTGLKASHGDFISFLDSDDEYLPEKIEKQVNIFRKVMKTGIGVVYCGMWKENRDKTYRYRLNNPTSKWFFLTQQIMLKKEVAERIGFFDTSFSTSDDADYVYRLKKVCRFAGTREPLIIYHDTPCSLDKNLKLLPVNRETFLKKHAGTMSPEEKSSLLCRAAKYYLHDRRTVKGYKSFFRAYIYYPLNIHALRKLIRLFPLFLFHILKEKKDQENT